MIKEQIKKVYKSIVKTLHVSLITIITGIIGTSLPLQGQNPVFADDSIPLIKIYINSDSLDLVFAPENADNDHEFPALFVFNNGAVTDSVDSVGFRLRGNTSRDSKKKSFKISFNTFEKGRKYHGQEKLNLNGEHNDPSIIRAKLAWDIFNSRKIPSSRSNHIMLYINDVYYGLYINVEHIDENFVDDHFDNNDGNLYKCLWPADLTYINNNVKDYPDHPYDLKTNTDLNDYSDLLDLIVSINFTPAEDFTEIEKIFNVDGFLKILAVDVLVGSWDDYWYLKNNYYLYHNSETGLFEFIPYDYDNTFGIDWVGGDWGTRDIYNWGNDTEPRPLANKILSVQEYRDRYSYYLNNLLNDVFRPDSLFPKIDAIHTMITSAAEADTFRIRDWEFSIDDFHNSYDQPVETIFDHVDYGLKPYITTRRNTALAQLQLNNILPIIKNIEFSPLVAQLDQPVDVTVYVEDDQVNPAVAINYTFNNAPRSAVMMYDDGLHGDGLAGDLIYGGQIPSENTSGIIRFYISATDGANQQSRLPRKAPVENIALQVGFDIPLLYINELLASNSTVNADNFGEFDDWVEIYNGGISAIGLGDKYLTDNFSNPDKWLLPDTTLQPGEFIIIWVDSDAEQGANHTPFKLDAQGDGIGIFRMEGVGFVPIDTLTFPAQETDISLGRSIDGGPDWQYFVNPTPGFSNVVTGIEDKETKQPARFSLQQNYPNPFNSVTKISFNLANDSYVQLEVFNILGQKMQTIINGNLKSGAHHFQLDANNWTSGIYFYTLKAYSKNSVVYSAMRKLVLLK